MSKSLKNFITIEVSIACESKINETLLIAFCIIRAGSFEDLVRKAIATRIHDANLECQDGSHRGYTDGNGEHRGNF